MATGMTSSISGTQTISSVYEMSTADDVLNIANAILHLSLPAGDIEMMQGADTLTVSNSTVNGDTGVAIKLGSGNDKVTLQNSTITSRISLASGDDLVIIAGSAQSTVTLNALDPDQTSIDTDEDLTTLSLGDGNDILELNAVLAGTGVIRFGNGVDTLKFNAGTLNNSGGMDKLENLSVTSLGGKTYRDIILTGTGNQITWGGNLVGSDNTKSVIIEAVENSPKASVSFVTDTNSVSNIGFNISDRTFTQSGSGTWEISGRTTDTAFIADDSIVTIYNAVFTENKTGFAGENTNWNISNTEISKNTSKGAIITGGSLTFDDVSFTDNKNALSLTSASLVGTEGAFTSNQSDVYGAAIYAQNGQIDLENTGFKDNTNIVDKTQADSVSATAKGGGIWSTESYLTISQAEFKNNTAAASAVAVFNNTSAIR